MTDISGDGHELFAVVDIGSNSVRMNIYDINTETGAFSVMSSCRAMLKLISYVSDGVLSADGEGKLFALIREYLAKANSVPCDKFVAFATASLRGLDNSGDIVRKIQNRLGVNIDIISGEDEANYDYIATTDRFKNSMAQRGVVIDMGGGSTEIIAFDDGRVRHSFSLPIGSLGLWKRFCGSRKDRPFPTKEEAKRIREYVSAQIKKAAPLKSFGGTAYLIGGTARAVCRIDAALDGAEEKNEGYVMPDSAFGRVVSALMNDAENGASLISRICPDRTMSVIQGAVAYETIIAETGVSRAVLSQAGVREGYVLEYIRRTYPKATQLF